MNAATLLTTLPERLNRGIDRWLTAPEVNAAGRIGLFRVLYGLFLLWIGSQGYFSIMAQTPTAAWQPVFFLRVHFTEGARMAIGQENRIVAEAFIAARRPDINSIDAAFGLFQMPIGPGHAQGRDEMRLAL